MLRVRDTGPGVPPHLIPHLFTPFFTTKSPGQGTGLGLSLSYGLVKAHGGELVYEAPAGGRRGVPGDPAGARRVGAAARGRARAEPADHGNPAYSGGR